jgi:hypothetical protein
MAAELLLPVLERLGGETCWGAAAAAVAAAEVPPPRRALFLLAEGVAGAGVLAGSTSAAAAAVVPAIANAVTAVEKEEAAPSCSMALTPAGALMQRKPT